METLITFNGIDLTATIPGFSVTEIKGRGPIAQDVNNIDVPGRPGTYFVERVIPARVIPVSFLITGTTLTDIRAKLDQLNGILNVSAPAPIVFNDEPTKTYYGILSGQPDWTEYMFTGQGTITFYCADPHKYSAQNTTATYTETTTLTANGNQNADPVTTIVLNADTTYLSLYNATTGKLNLLGMPTKPGETPTDKDTLITLEQFTTLTGWTAPASTEDGTVAGAMQVVGGYEFQASSYGTGTGWHGPALKKSLPSTVQDFKADFYFKMSNNTNFCCGGIVISLLDGQNNVVAKGSIYKYYPGMGSIFASLRAGKAASGYTSIQDRRMDGTAVSAMVRLSRKGTDWTFVVFRNLAGRYYPITVLDPKSFWKDSGGIATAQITQIQVQLLQRDAITACFQSADDLAVWRQNSLTAGQLPYVGKNGDTIVFDHKNNIITRNGVDVTKDKAFIGEYWPLVPGSNNIIAEPASAFASVQTQLQDKWL